MINENIVIINRLGLHTRAAAKLVSLAGKFQCKIEVTRKDSNQKANCKSIMAIMLLGVTCGTALKLSTVGDDELEAKDAIVDLIKAKFGEQE